MAMARWLLWIFSGFTIWVCRINGALSLYATDRLTHTYCRRTRLKDCQLIFIARISSFFYWLMLAQKDKCLLLRSCSKAFCIRRAFYSVRLYYICYLQQCRMLNGGMLFEAHCFALILSSPLHSTHSGLVLNGWGVSLSIVKSIEYKYTKSRLHIHWHPRSHRWTSSRRSTLSIELNGRHKSAHRPFDFQSNGKFARYMRCWYTV